MGKLGEDDVLIVHPELTRLAYSYMFITPTDRKNFLVFFFLFFFSLKDSVSLVGFLSARVFLGNSEMVRFYDLRKSFPRFPAPVTEHRSWQLSSLVNTRDSLDELTVFIIPVAIFFRVGT